MTFNKYNAHKVTIAGETFDSQAEARRWRDLLWLQRGGVIHGLKRQVKYLLIPKQVTEDGEVLKPVTYIADFVYRDEHNKLVVEDVKGYTKGPAWALFQLKRKLMYEKYGIFVQVVKR